LGGGDNVDDVIHDDALRSDFLQVDYDSRSS
jgi:hypothetical protein